MWTVVLSQSPCPTLVAARRDGVAEAVAASPQVPQHPRGCRPRWRRNCPSRCLGKATTEPATPSESDRSCLKSSEKVATCCVTMNKGCSRPAMPAPLTRSLSGLLSGSISDRSLCVRPDVTVLPGIKPSVSGGGCGAEPTLYVCVRAPTMAQQSPGPSPEGPLVLRGE